MTPYYADDAVTIYHVKGGQVVVSPTGMAHHGVDGGKTACGKDTAGINYRNWWWPL